MSEAFGIADLARYAEEQIGRVALMRQQLADNVGAGTSPRGLVHARTGPGGRLIALSVKPALLDLTLDRLVAEVTAAIGAAQENFGAGVDEIMAPFLSTRPSDTARDLVDDGIKRLEAMTADIERLVTRYDHGR